MVWNGKGIAKEIWEKFGIAKAQVDEEPICPMVFLRSECGSVPGAPETGVEMNTGMEVDDGVRLGETGRAEDGVGGDSGEGVTAPTRYRNEFENLSENEFKSSNATSKFVNDDLLFQKVLKHIRILRQD